MSRFKGKKEALMRFIITVLFISTMFSLPYNAYAEEAEEDNNINFRVRLLIHSNWEINKNLAIRAHFIPAPNLIGNLAPLMYIGLGWQAVEWLNIEPVIGWNFGIQEPMLSVRITPSFQNSYVWIDIELCLPSLNGYWFFQAEVKIRPWLHAGFEYEGWGNYTDRPTQNHGAGPNILLRSRYVGLDFTLHIRNSGIDPFVRMHLFL